MGKRSEARQRFSPALQPLTSQARRPAWGSEADALYDIAISQCVEFCLIEQFCAFSIVEPPTFVGGLLVGAPTSFGTNLGSTNSFGTNLSSAPFWPRPRFAGRKWGHPLLGGESSEPTQQYAEVGPPKIGTKIGGSAYWILAQVDLPTFSPRQWGSNFEPLYFLPSASIASKMGTNLFICFPTVGHSTLASQSSRGLKYSSPEVSHPPSG